jgi:hypothetical protein
MARSPTSRSAEIVWVLAMSLSSLRAQRIVPLPYREEPPFDLKAAFGTREDWKAVVRAAVEPTREFEKDEGTSQSRICFARTAPASSECSYFTDLFHSNLTIQVFSSLSVVRLESGSAVTSGAAINGLVMKAAAWYPTGQVPETAIWVYDAQRDHFRLASAVESGEVRIFSSGPLNGILVTADWHRGEGESRFSDHQRDITVYRYRADNGEAGYGKVLEYTTTKKYGAEDTNTVDAELADIEEKIR